MCEVNLLPAAWINAQRAIEAEQSQHDILADALERLLAAGASDAVIEAVLTAVDAVDAAVLDAAAIGYGAAPAVDVDVDVVEYPELAEPEDSERGIRQQVIAQLRAEGYVGAGFDVLVTLRHRDLAEDEYLRADNELRGKLVRTEFQSNYSARKLWFCSDRELRKYASDELLAWFDQYGRLTRAQLGDNLLGRRHYAGSGYYLA